MMQNFCRLMVSAVLLCALTSISSLAQEKPGEKKSAAAERSKVMKEIDFNWKRAKKWTMDYIDAMPEDAISFKPTPDVRSFGEQMLHLAFWNCGLAEAAGSKPNPFGKDEIEKKPEYKSKAELRRVVEQSYDYVLAAVADLDEKKLLEEVAFFNSKVTRLMALTIALDHQTHHRGQTTIYLRLKGVTPPPEP
jgi:uncharacterized damage-inducible protein DinB